VTTEDRPTGPPDPKPPIDPRLLLAVAVLATIGIVLLYALTIFDCGGA
jgi:hypothetical protein